MGDAPESLTCGSIPRLLQVQLQVTGGCTCLSQSTFEMLYLVQNWRLGLHFLPTDPPSLQTAAISLTKLQQQVPQYLQQEVTECASSWSCTGQGHKTRQACPRYCFSMFGAALQSWLAADNALLCNRSIPKGCGGQLLCPSASCVAQ